MRAIAKITFFFASFFFFISQCCFGQTCGVVYTHYISDMTLLDSDNSDGLNIPDGIFNLYDADVALSPNSGDRWFDPSFNFILDTDTGDLNVWGLENASETEYDYVFQLLDASSSCIASVRIVLAPYSGLELPANNGISLEVCDVNYICLEGGNVQTSYDIDLFETLVTREGVPPPHLNGKWEYLGVTDNDDFTNARLIIRDVEIEVMGQTMTVADTTSLFSTTITYKPGGTDRVDEAVFDFNYIVPTSISDPLMEFEADTTSVRISVVRQVFSGFPSLYNLCESELDGSDATSRYLTPEDLTDDRYLLQEDIEGQWIVNDSLTGGEISRSDDSLVDFKKLYDDMIAEDPRFGRKDFQFTYFVEKRSGVCSADTSTIRMTIFEELKPFQQNTTVPNEFCATRGSDQEVFDLFDFLEFTTENGVVFEYTDGIFGDNLVGWSLVSHPQRSSDTSKTLLATDNADNELHLGTVTVGNAEPGKYVFRYTVSPNKLIAKPPTISQVNSCLYDTDEGEHPCPDMTGEVEIVILPYDYAGEVTPDPDDPEAVLPGFCEAEGTINLLDQLRTTFDNEVVPGGNWQDEFENNISNEFVIPEIDGQQDFSFTYTTESDKGCVDSASLSFRVYQEATAGTPSDGEVCRESGVFELFSLLTDADQNGFWTGPVGYNSRADLNADPHLGRLNLLDNSKNWQSGEYKYIVPGNGACTTSSEASINLTIIEAITASFDIDSQVFCKSEGQTNLFQFLDDTNSALDGTFVRIDDGSNDLIDNGILLFDDWGAGTFRFQYSVPNGNCAPAVDEIEIRIVTVQVPDEANPTEFCILEAATLDAVNEVYYVQNDGGRTLVDNVVWYATIDGDQTVSRSTLLVDGQTFYAAAQGENGCESERLAVTIRVLNLGEKDCALEFQEGVAPNTTGEDNTFNLTEWRSKMFNIPEVFSDFELLIYNRFGTLVYKAGKNTAEFNGFGNTGLQLGKNLPSGVYFYVFNPNKDANQPIQGNFYLSK